MPDAWSGLDAAFAELEAECTDIIRGFTVRAFNSILSKTPQFQGRMAASWSYCLNHPHFDDRSAMVTLDRTATGVHTELGYYQEGVQGLYRGHPVAIAIANAANAGRDKAFKLGDIVYLTNGVNHGEGSYSDSVESGEITLRAENQPGAPVSRTIDYMGVYYQAISPVKARSLKALQIGAPDASSNP